jgi:hypothetical protein
LTPMNLRQSGSGKRERASRVVLPECNDEVDQAHDRKAF